MIEQDTEAIKEKETMVQSKLIEKEETKIDRLEGQDNKLKRELLGD